MCKSGFALIAFIVGNNFLQCASGGRSLEHQTQPVSTTCR